MIELTLGISFLEQNQVEGYLTSYLLTNTKQGTYNFTVIWVKYIDINLMKVKLQSSSL